MEKKTVALIAGLSLLILALFSFLNVLASATVTPATGGSAISADTTGGTYTALTGPTLSEGVSRDISTAGTIILNAPSGFIFNTGQSVTATIVRDSGNQACFTFTSTTATPTTGTITFTVQNLDGTGGTPGPCHVTFSNIQVRPSSGTPLASGNITKSGTAVINGVTGSTNFGTLTEVAGAKTQLVITTQPSSSASVGVDFSAKPVIAVRDQFGNTVTSDNATTIAIAPVLSTQACGGTAGSGTLSSTPASGAAVTSGAMTYSAMQYSAAEAIKICATSAGITSALTNAVTVSNPTPTTTGISPTSQTAGAAAFSLIVNGTNFIPSSVVQFNGSSRTTTYVSSVQLSASILASDIAATGTFPIVVSSPSPGGGLSNSQTFTVTSVPLGFSLTNEGNKSVTQGSSVTNIITAAYVTGASSTVSFSASGLPSGASAAFSPASCVPACSSVLTISTLSSVAVGSSSITVAGNDGTNSTATTFALTVNAPPPPSSSPSSGVISVGGTMGGTAPSSAYFSGQAYPGITIKVFRKSEITGPYESIPFTSASVADDGTFKISILNFLQANYFFAIQAIDKSGRESRILPLVSQFVFAGNSLFLNGIGIPPTIEVSSASVPIGQNVKVVGYAAPQSSVEVLIDGNLQGETISGASGAYAFSTSTTGMPLADHTVKARFVLADGTKSDYSLEKAFRVSELAFPKADLSGDGTVNSTDWSIFLFRWGSKDQALRASIDFNGDGKVDITDFSIFLSSIRTK